MSEGIDLGGKDMLDGIDIFFLGDSVLHTICNNR